MKRAALLLGLLLACSVAAAQPGAAPRRLQSWGWALRIGPTWLKATHQSGARLHLDFAAQEPDTECQAKEGRSELVAVMGSLVTLSHSYQTFCEGVTVLEQRLETLDLARGGQPVALGDLVDPDSHELLEPSAPQRVALALELARRRPGCWLSAELAEPWLHQDFMVEPGAAKGWARITLGFPVDCAQGARGGTLWLRRQVPLRPWAQGLLEQARRRRTLPSAWAASLTARPEGFHPAPRSGGF